jgi:hypothetical protein
MCGTCEEIHVTVNKEYANQRAYSVGAPQPQRNPKLRNCYQPDLNTSSSMEQQELRKQQRNVWED